MLESYDIVLKIKVKALAFPPMDEVSEISFILL